MASTKFQKGFFYSFIVEVTGAARLYRAASVWTAGLGGAASPHAFLEQASKVLDEGAQNWHVAQSDSHHNRPAHYHQ